MEKSKRILTYQSAYLSDYGFESVLVAQRQKLVLDCLSHYMPRVVLEVGCGTDLLFNQASTSNLDIQQWIIVEPSCEFARTARETRACETEIDLQIVDGFLEDVGEEVLSAAVNRPDFVICSSVLHEVPNPNDLLRTVRDLLAANGVLHVNVPNAFSLHRRLARTMNLITDEREFGERDKKLSRFRIFDSRSLSAFVQSNGFVIEDSGGYFIKPFTNRQMQGLGSLLTQRMIDGLNRLGQELPELANEIYVNGRLKEKQ